MTSRSQALESVARAARILCTDVSGRGLVPMIRDVHDALATLDAAEPDSERWRDAKTEPPTEPGWYLAYDSTGDHWIAGWNTGFSGWENDEYMHLSVTHWRPLPEPPAARIEADQAGRGEHA